MYCVICAQYFSPPLLLFLEPPISYIQTPREKQSSAADVRSDGHGGFHNPMAALRAQQQQQQQHVRVGRIAPAPGGSYTSPVVDAMSSESVPSEGRSGVDEEGLPSVPAWMVNKGLITGGRNPSGVLLARPGRGRLHGGGRGGGSALRPSAGSVLGGRPSTAYGPLSGGRVGVGFGGGSGVNRVQEAPTSPSAPSTNKEASSLALANEKAPSSPVANDEAPSLPLIVEDAPSESGAVSSSRVPSRPEKKESLEGTPLLDSSGGSDEVVGTSVNTENVGALPEAASSLPAADARDSKQSRTPRLSISSLPLATIIPTDDDSPLPGEVVEATHMRNHSGGFVNGGIGLSGGAPVKAGREVGNDGEVPLFGTELDPGAEFSGPDGEFLVG